MSYSDDERRTYEEKDVYYLALTSTKSWEAPNKSLKMKPTSLIIDDDTDIAHYLKTVVFFSLSCGCEIWCR